MKTLALAHGGRTLLLLALVLGLGKTPARADHRLRIVAANITSGRSPVYEGPGTRILKGLDPDVVLIQEFNTPGSRTQWVEDTFGPGFVHTCERGVRIPNGIISRYPFIEDRVGQWEDPEIRDRNFSFAVIDLPGVEDHLLAVSVHLKSGKKGANKRTRIAQAEVIVAQVRAAVSRWTDIGSVTIGGDMNFQSHGERALQVLAEVVQVDEVYPVDQDGNPYTNASRRKPYDWVLVSSALSARETPVVFGAARFPTGFVFDSRVTPRIPEIGALPEDSQAMNMQHMAVVREFKLP